MSLLRRLLMDVFAAKSSTLSSLKSVSVAASYYTRSNQEVRKPNDIKEVESMVAFYEGFIPEQLTRSSSVQDIVKANPSRIPRLLYQRASTETGWEDPYLEKKLERLAWISLHLIEWMMTREPSLLVAIFLKFMTPVTVDMKISMDQVKKIHGLAVTTGMIEDEENLRSLMELYLNSGGLEECERIFESADKKGLILYNQQLKVYSTYDAQKATRLFAEMIKTGLPNGDTFRELLNTFSLHCQPGNAHQGIRGMPSCGVRTEPRHYGVLIDAYARMRTPLFIEESIAAFKSHPKAQNEVSINGILSRCVPPPGVSAERIIKEAADKLDLKQLVKQACDEGFDLAEIFKSLDGEGLDLKKRIKQGPFEGLDLKRIFRQARIDGLDLEDIMLQALGEGFDLPQTLKGFLVPFYARFVPPPSLEMLIEEEKADLKIIISHAQHLVDYLEEKKFYYAVLNKTHWRLAKHGLKWPKRVTKK